MSFFTAANPVKAVAEASLVELTEWLMAENIEFGDSSEEVRAAALAHILTRRDTIFQIRESGEEADTVKSSNEKDEQVVQHHQPQIPPPLPLPLLLKTLRVRAQIRQLQPRVVNFWKNCGEKRPTAVELWDSPLQFSRLLKIYPLNNP